MKEPRENKLDQLFKDGLSASETPIVFREQDWLAMRKLLKKNSGNKKGAIYPFAYYASGIAAVVLLTLALFLKNQQHTNDLTKERIVKRNTRSQPDNDSAKSNNRPKANLTVDKTKSGIKLSGSPANIHTQPQQNTANLNKYNPGPLKAHKPVSVNTDLFSRITSDIKDIKEKGIKDKEIKNIKVGEKLNPMPDSAESALLSNQVEKKEMQQSFTKNKSVFSLSILAAPDLNGVNSFHNGQVGVNLGFQLGIQISKKWSISTGAVYAVKPYGININTNTTNYTANGAYAQPLNYIDANCRVLDIPLNLNYQLYNKGKNTLNVGSGLSSYFMLRETYRYDYGPEYSTVQIKNRNQHIMGVLNLNTTYTGHVNAHFSIIAQPYIKLPLTGIGNGRVDLQSTGIGLGVNWNLNLKQKPK